MTSSPEARWGITVFILGIILLLAVFVLSYRLFNGTAHAIVGSTTIPIAELPPLSRVMAEAAVKLGLLLAMGYFSSLIAGKGLSLYGASRREASVE